MTDFESQIVLTQVKCNQNKETDKTSKVSTQIKYVETLRENFFFLSSTTFLYVVCTYVPFFSNHLESQLIINLDFSFISAEKVVWIYKGEKIVWERKKKDF